MGPNVSSTRPTTNGETEGLIRSGTGDMGRQHDKEFVWFPKIGPPERT